MRRCLRWMKRSRRWGSRQMKFRNFLWCLSKAVRMACKITAASAWRISKRAKRRNSSRAPTPSIRFVFRNGSKNMWCVRCVDLTAGPCSPATSVRHSAPIQKTQTQVLNPYLVVQRVGTLCPASPSAMTCLYSYFQNITMGGGGGERGVSWKRRRRRKGKGENG